MTETTRLMRAHVVHADHMEWVVQGVGGAVSFAVGTPATRPEFYGPVGLHYAPDTVPSEGMPSGECHLLAGGVCHADTTFIGGHDLGERWDATGRRDETIYAELEDWYASRFTD